MRKASKWQDYEVLDAGELEKIERYNDVLIKRPELVAPWKTHRSNTKVDAHYTDQWKYFRKVEPQIITYGDMKFKVKFENSKQTGIFPEQAVNWDWMRSIMKSQDQPVRILNLFGYTGGATIACAMENVEEVVHIDALKSSIEWTQENIELNNLQDKKIRTIVDDVMKFVQREKRRGRRYHGIILDPPSFGRGPKGERWKIEDQLPKLLQAVVDILDDDALFITLNTYTTNLEPKAVEKIMNDVLRNNGINPQTHSDTIGLPIKSTGNELPCGVTTRWCYRKDLL